MSVAMVHGYKSSSQLRTFIQFSFLQFKTMKKFEICLILLIVGGAVSALPGPSGFLNTALKPSSAVNYDFWCQDNNIPHDWWFVFPGWCDWTIACWDNHDGRGVSTYFEQCDHGWYFRVGWEGNVVCAPPKPTDVCDDSDLTWPLRPPNGTVNIPTVPTVLDV